MNYKIYEENFSVIDVMNEKRFHCRYCNELVTFTEEVAIYELSVDSPSCDGLNMICRECGFDDDISQMYCVFRDGSIMNVQDFYAEYGFYGENQTGQIIKALSLLEDR